MNYSSHTDPRKPMALCIGGPMNGKRVNWTDRERHVPVPDYSRSATITDPSIYPVATHIYRLEIWASEHCEFHVYVHESLTNDEAMAYVIGGYPLACGNDVDFVKAAPHRIRTCVNE